MFGIISKLKNRKGFTLIELIVVLAVLAVIMAIAVPRFMGIQEESNKKADAATAQQIIKSARLQAARNNDGDLIADIDVTSPGTGYTEWDKEIMIYDGTKFTLSYNSTTKKYEVAWEANDGDDLKMVEGDDDYTTIP